MPRAAAVSKVNQASMMPPSRLGLAVEARSATAGHARSVAASIAAIAVTALDGA